MNPKPCDVPSNAPPLPGTAEELLPLVYEELRRMAAQRMSAQMPGQTLQATSLVHDAWIRLGDGRFESRAHFFSATAQAMRHLLIERARHKLRVRHGGGMERVDLDQVDVASTADDATLLWISEALDKLHLEAPEKVELIKLRYFAGLSIENAANALGISPATAKRHWAFARAWLFSELQRGI